MNPILLGRHVEQGLRELVHSTLNTTSSGFEGAVERFLENPNHFMKGPWVTVDLPFKNIEDSLGNLHAGETGDRLGVGLVLFAHGLPDRARGTGGDGRVVEVAG